MGFLDYSNRMSYGNYPDLTNVRKILVVKLRHLGDVLLTSPIFTLLKKRMPEAQIDAYIYSDSFPMLEGHPAISHLIGYDKGIKKLSFFSRLKRELFLLWKIRKEKYDLVINLTEGDRGAIVCKMSGAKILVGMEGDKKRKVYTHIIKKCHALRHTVERNLDALRVIGIFPNMEERELYYHIPESAMSKIKHLLQDARFSLKEFYLIHPASRWRFKCWPEEKVREVIQTLLSQEKKVVITSGGDKEEKEMVERIIQGISHPNLLNLSAKVTLKELGALIQLCKGLLCVDSVSFHMASALKANVTVLFGPTSDVTWGPWNNPNAQVLTQAFSCRPCYSDGCAGSKKSDCLTTLPVQKVLTALLKSEVRTQKSEVP